MTGDDDRPEWWLRDERDRERLGLAPYEPPRFADGTPIYEVIDALEAEHGCTIRIRGIDTTYPDDLTLDVDGETVTTIGRHRDEHANTVFELPAERFRSLVRGTLDGR